MKLRETEISNLKSKIEKLNSANFELKKTISGFEREHENMKAKIRFLERKNNAVADSVQVNSQKKISKKKSSKSEFLEKGRSRNNKN